MNSTMPAASPPRQDAGDVNAEDHESFAAAPRDRAATRLTGGAAARPRLFVGLANAVLLFGAHGPIFSSLHVSFT